MPPVGVSSRPMIESSVDLPQPDGPDMATYSPLSIDKVHAGERVGFDFVGVEDLGHILNLDQRLRGVSHESFASIPLV